MPMMSSASLLIVRRMRSHCPFKEGLFLWSVRSVLGVPVSGSAGFSERRHHRAVAAALPDFCAPQMEFPPAHIEPLQGEAKPCLYSVHY